MLEAILIDGTGTSLPVGVNSENKLLVAADSASIQHRASFDHGEAFQVMGVVSTVTSGINTILHLRNDSSDYKAVITYIRVQAVDLTGGTALPSKNTYFSVGFDTTVTASGTAVDATILNRALTTNHYTTSYSDKPNVSDDYLEIDRWYVEDNGKMMTYNKEGTVILGINDTIEVRLVTDHSAGEVFARISFCKLLPTVRR